MKTFLVAFLGSFLVSLSISAQTSDAALRRVTEQDAGSRNAAGALLTLPVPEHLARGQAYLDNRLFPQAREHFHKVLNVYPTDTGLAQALFGIARSLMWEREYAAAIPYFDRVSREFPATKYGREGLAFKGACNVRMGKNAEAARVYQQYTVMYPQGERVDSAHLNIIDALREDGNFGAALEWVAKARGKFAGTPTEVNAMHALVRMEINRGQWMSAVSAADSLLTLGSFSASMTSADEIKYLKAVALERAGEKQRAIEIYAGIPNSASSYYGGLAAERLAKLGAKFNAPIALTAKQIADSPVVYRAEVLSYGKRNNVDPRFMLAIMKQESAFKASAKSPAAARGLLQLVFDTALKYNKKAGYPSLQPDDLYTPTTNIAIGSAYIGALKNDFGGLYEAIAASYNAGEDNAQRWLNRSKPKDPGIFASEVGFAETKNYVYKVMNNYRIYRQLYDENLNRL